MYTQKVIFPRRKFVVMLVLFSSTILLYFIHHTVFELAPWSENIEMDMNIPRCYQFPINSNCLNDDILNAKIKIEPGRSIFFVITTCSDNNVIVLKQR